MISKFFSGIHNAIFSPLRSWAEQSPGNWNILIIVGFYWFMVAGFWSMYFIKSLEKTTNGQIKSI